MTSLFNQIEKSNQNLMLLAAEVLEARASVSPSVGSVCNKDAASMRVCTLQFDSEQGPGMTDIEKWIRSEIQGMMSPIIEKVTHELFQKLSSQLEKSRNADPVEVVGDVQPNPLPVQVARKRHR